MRHVHEAFHAGPPVIAQVSHATSDATASPWSANVAGAASASDTLSLDVLPRIRPTREADHSPLSLLVAISCIPGMSLIG